MSLSSYFSRRGDIELAVLGDQINPARLAAVQFTVTRRGYDRNQVDTYRARAAAALTDAERRRSDAESAMRSLQNRLRMIESRGVPEPADNTEAIRTIAVAQQTADRILSRSEEVARQTEGAAKRYYADVVARAHMAARRAAERADAPWNVTASAEAVRADRDRERSIAYLQTFLEVVRAGRTEVAAYERVLEKLLDMAELVVSGLQHVEHSAGAALQAAAHQQDFTDAAADSMRETA